uniref:Uncharacterized protein n=2 Tax=Lygus hesperus TaxID=30085 RepID=A0A146L6U4_LYGHE
MLRIHTFLLLLSGMVLVSLAEDVAKQTKSDLKDKSNKDATATHKPAMELEASHVVSNHSETNAGKKTDKPKNDKAEHEDMKSSATIGLGFYAGVLPVGYPSYPRYQYYRPYYYSRPYWGYRYYRPVPVVFARPRPVPLLLG